MGRFDERVVVVTGGATGIGRATACALAREGAEVFLAGRNVEQGEATAASIKAAGGRARFIRVDVADDAQVAALAQIAATDRGKIDVWFNNAGIEGSLGDLTEFDDTSVSQLLATNVKGVYSGMRHAVAWMAPGGIIINTASFVGTVTPVPVAVAYGATKAAVVSMTASAAESLRDRGITVVAVCPWIVDTPMVDRLTGGGSHEDKAAFARAFAPSGRLTHPDDVAAVVLDLAATRNRVASGTALLVDAGGVTAVLERPVVTVAA